VRYELDYLIKYLLSVQRKDGGFDTYESYPVVKPEQGWTILPVPSPFITSNILFSLSGCSDEKAKEIIRKGCLFLEKCKEREGYWRFWPLNSGQHPVPLDVDDTAIASYVLHKNGKQLKNRDFLSDNTDSRGYIYTWLLPSFPLFFRHPLKTVCLLKDYWAAHSTIKLNHFSVEDTEPGVAANALLYLGENANTQKCIELIQQEIIRGEFPMKFYNHKIVVYYHISRAYKESIPSFKSLKGKILTEVQHILSTEPELNEMLKLMAANILLNFSDETETAELILKQTETCLLHPFNLQPRAYFCSHDRNFLAGSPAYTAALFIEAACKLKG
jgi:hypothetical protein